ncbi:type II secretion system F family protein [Polaromonas sp.]|uniref:type II secretion system F family protein n=1 Tax=Polaromonas sp. TaxID=1869339 RepID=UPI003569B871
MKLFEYKALGADGRRLRGLLSAEHGADLRQQLQEASLLLVHARPMTQLRWRLRIAPNVPLRDLAAFFGALAQVVSARTPLLRGLRAIGAGTPNRTLREVIDDLVNQVSRGRPLALALGTFPAVFGPVVVALTAAGERTGRLDLALRQCQLHCDWQDRTSRRLSQALAYPILLLGLTLAMVVFLLSWLAPKLLAFLTVLGQAPGPATRTLLGLAQFLERHGGLAVTALGAVGAALVAAALTSATVRRQLHVFVLKIPVAGGLARRVDVQRFAQFVAVGVTSGLSTQRALEVGLLVVRNAVLREQLELALARLGEGWPLSTALAGTQLFTPLMLETMSSSQLTDDLGPAFERVARAAGEDLDALAAAVVGVVPTALTLIVGVLLAWVVAALYLPIYSTLSLEMLYR